MVSRSSNPLYLPPTPDELAWLAQQARAFRQATTSQHAAKAPSTRLRRRLTPETVSELVQRYRHGESSTTLSRTYGVSKSGLIQLLRAEGVVIRDRSVTAEATQTAIQLYESGLSITEIVAQVGYPYSTVRKSLNASGGTRGFTCAFL